MIICLYIIGLLNSWRCKLLLKAKYIKWPNVVMCLRSSISGYGCLCLVASWEIKPHLFPRKICLYTLPLVGFILDALTKRFLQSLESKQRRTCIGWRECRESLSSLKLLCAALKNKVPAGAGFLRHERVAATFFLCLVFYSFFWRHLRLGSCSLS